MPAWFRICSPAATSAPPIQLASTGLPKPLAYGFNFSAICVGFVMSCGVSTTSIPSMAGSFADFSDFA
jgi:hypothetical protein